MTQQPTPSQLPPSSEEGEMVILSCILLDGSASLAKAYDGKIDEDSFTHPRYRRIWKMAQWMHRNNKPLELHVMAEELKKVGKLDEVGGYTGLVEATSKAVTTLELDYWIEKVRHCQVMRKVFDSATRMREKVLTQSASIPDFVTEVNSIISLHHAGEKQVSVGEAAASAAELVGRIRDGKVNSEDMGYPFPWTDWDLRLGKAKRGELIIISARPGVGKSSVARQIAWHWGQTGSVLLFSREMNVQQITPLIAQCNTEVSWKAITEGKSSPAEMEKVEKELRRLEKFTGIQVYDRDRTLSHIVTRAKACAQTVPVKAIIVDYLQRYDAQQERGETRDIALGRFTMAMKDLAIELNIPVILLAQIGRAVEKEGREPRLSDLRESGNLEQDADRVIFLHAPDHTPEGVPQNFTDNDIRYIYVDAIQAKGRSDGVGRATMKFDRPITKFIPYVPFFHHTT